MSAASNGVCQMALAPTAFPLPEQLKLSTAKVFALAVPVTSWGPQLENPGMPCGPCGPVWFHVCRVSVTLQMGVGIEQLAGLGGRFPVTDLGGRPSTDLAHVAALVKCLDVG